jgi:rare lipoprotein A (peptidoglycan hydrolase)
MGPKSNDNPFCGMYVTLKRGTAQVVAKVVDKCPGCNGYSIDLSHKAFDALCDESVGRTTAEWWFN